MSLERVTDEMKNGSAEKKKKKNTNWLKVVHSLSKKKKKDDTRKDKRDYSKSRMWNRHTWLRSKLIFCSPNISSNNS